MDAAQKLINNLVILSKILEYLSLEEQVKCLEISKSFRHAITTVLWKKHYRELNLYKTPYISIINKKSQDSGEDLVTLQEIQEFKTSLKYDKCNVFLRSLAPHVHKLSVFSEYFIFRHNMGVAFRNIQKFINLRQLNFTQMVVTSDHMELIAAKCRRLRRLEFIECISETWNPLLPGYNLDIATLGQLRYLSDLTLQCQLMENPPTLECNIVHELLSKLRLKRLVMRNLNIVDFGSDTVQHIVHGGCVEVLHVGNISLEFWPHFKHHLKEFHNLSDLFINVVDCNTLLSSPDLELLANHCPKLLKLTLENCDLEVADFGLLKSVQHLALNSCGGFRAANLKQVLSRLPLVSLSLVNTRVLGNIMGISVGAQLETIKVDTIHFHPITEAFQRCQNEMPAVHTIKWLNGDISDSWIMDKCPNLKILHIPNPYLMRHGLLKMTSLQELSFSSCKGFSWCFLVLLIKNLKLQRLNIYTTEGIDDVKEKPENACDVRTTVRRVLLPYRIYKMAQDFWMDLLVLNRKLKLSFYGEHEDLLCTNFLRGLLRFLHVRDNLKCLKVCGFVVDIRDLQENFDKTMHKLNSKTSHYRAKNSKFTIEI